MKCPHCGNSLRRSVKNPDFGLCDICRKKYLWENIGVQRSTIIDSKDMSKGTYSRSSTYRDIHVNELKEKNNVPLFVCLIFILAMLTTGVILVWVKANRSSTSGYEDYYNTDIKHAETYSELISIDEWRLSDNDKKKLSDKLLNYITDNKCLQGICYSAKYVYDDAGKYPYHSEGVHKSLAIYMNNQDELYIIPDPSFSDIKEIESMSNKDDYRYRVTNVSTDWWFIPDDGYTRARVWPYNNKGILDGTYYEIFSEKIDMRLIEMTLEDPNGRKVDLWFDEKEGFVGFLSSNSNRVLYPDNGYAFYFDKSVADSFADLK